MDSLSDLLQGCAISSADAADHLQDLPALISKAIHRPGLPLIGEQLRDGLLVFPDHLEGAGCPVATNQQILEGCPPFNDHPPVRVVLVGDPDFLHRAPFLHEVQGDASRHRATCRPMAPDGLDPVRARVLGRVEQADMGDAIGRQQGLNVDQRAAGLGLLIAAVDPLDGVEERIGDEHQAGLLAGMFQQKVGAGVVPGEVVLLGVETDDLWVQRAVGFHEAHGPEVGGGIGSGLVYPPQDDAVEPWGHWEAPEEWAAEDQISGKAGRHLGLADLVERSDAREASLRDQAIYEPLLLRDAGLVAACGALGGVPVEHGPLDLLDPLPCLGRGYTQAQFSSKGGGPDLPADGVLFMVRMLWVEHRADGAFPPIDGWSSNLLIPRWGAGRWQLVAAFGEARHHCTISPQRLPAVIRQPFLELVHGSAGPSGLCQRPLEPIPGGLAIKAAAEVGR